LRVRKSANNANTFDIYFLSSTAGSYCLVQFGTSGNIWVYQHPSWQDTGIAYAANTWYKVTAEWDFGNLRNRDRSLPTTHSLPARRTSTSSAITIPEETPTSTMCTAQCDQELAVGTVLGFKPISNGPLIRAGQSDDSLEGISRSRGIDPWQRAGERVQAPDGRWLPAKVAKDGRISKIVGDAAGDLE
jgi:hypothetical protein